MRSPWLLQAPGDLAKNKDDDRHGIGSKPFALWRVIRPAMPSGGLKLAQRRRRPMQRLALSNWLENKSSSESKQKVGCSFATFCWKTALRC